MDWLSPPWRIALSTLLGLYLGFVVVRSLQGGIFRYKGRAHARSDEPKTFWMGVIWFAVLTLVMLGYAALQARQTFGAPE